jgi:Ca-activated chloride channel family protein
VGPNSPRPDCDTDVALSAGIEGRRPEIAVSWTFGAEAALERGPEAPMVRHSTAFISVLVLLPLAAAGCSGLNGSGTPGKGSDTSLGGAIGSGAGNAGTTGSAGAAGPLGTGTGAVTGAAGTGILPPGVPAGAGTAGAVGAVGTGGSAPSNTGDQYVPVGTNPFIMTAHDPLSTFAADVDTASYDILRRDVNLGMLPQPASVRLEEHVNNFRYAYPAPTAADPHPFRISLAAVGDMFHRETTLLRVGIQALEPPPFEKRPANVVFLVDVSGSMASDDKLPLVKRVLTRTLDILSPDDTVSIVTYSNTVGVRVPPTRVRDKAQIVPIIDGLVASGGTAGGPALMLAYQQARNAYIEGGINHILLCTDGDFNIGPSSTEELLALVKRERQSGVTLTVLGFGIGNLNDQLMERVSNAGNGIYGVISSAAHADTYVQQRLLSTVVHVAQNMKIQVEFNPARVISYRLLGYEDRAVADMDFRNDAVDGGEVGAGHRVTALYELLLTGQVLGSFEGAPAVVDGPPKGVIPEVDPADLVLVKVRYQAAGAPQDSPALEVRAGLPADSRGVDLGAADADMRWATAVAAFAEILKRSPYADRAFLPSIEAIVAEQAARDTDRTEFSQLFARAKGLLPASP